MKIWIGIAAAAMVCALGVSPAFAQTARQDLQQYINSHPEVQQNLSLLRNPNYLAHHPKLDRFLREHPNLVGSGYGRRYGAYDNDHQWRDPDWWYRNDPNWVYQNRRDWIQEHPTWLNDGDYDDAHRWHNREWWLHNQPNWVNKRHPNWVQSHPLPPPAYYSGERHEGVEHRNQPEHRREGNAYGHDKPHGNPHGDWQGEHHGDHRDRD